MDTALPPGPRLSPLRQQLKWTYQPFPWLEENARTFGDVFTLRFPGFPPMVMVSDPELIRQVFTGDPNVLEAGKANAILRPVVGDSSMLLLDGPRHVRERKLMMPPFHGERMQSYTDAMRAATDRVIDGWKQGARFALHPYMQQITMDVIMRAVFGMEEGESLRTLRERLRELLDFGSSPTMFLLFARNGDMELKWYQRVLGPLSPWLRWMKLKESVDAILMSEIRRRRDSGVQGQDILSMLLAARDEEGKPMTEQELHDEMITLVVAGHETTATVLATTFFWLLTNPDVLARADAELAKVVGDGALAAKHVPQLEYLDAIAKESQRLTPVVPSVARVLSQPLRLGRFELPAGVVVAPSIYLTHRRPDLWPEPERFNPDRFIERRPSPYEYFPFGGGARRCIGMAFAQLEMKVVLAEVLLRTRLRLAPGYRGRPVRRGVTFGMAEGLPVVFEGRRQSAAQAA